MLLVDTKCVRERLPLLFAQGSLVAFGAAVLAVVRLAELGLIELRLIKLVVELLRVEVSRGPAAVRIADQFFFELAHRVVELGLELLGCLARLVRGVCIISHRQTP